MNLFSITNQNIKIVSRFAIILIVIIVTGCTVGERYQKDDWAVLEDSSSECPIISGYYVDTGKKHGGSLIRQLMPTSPDKEISETTHVKIIQTEVHTIAVIALNDGSPLGETAYLRLNKDYHCKNGFIIFDVSQGWFGGAEVYGYESGRRYYRKTADGSLVGQYNSSGFGVVMLVLPVFPDQWSWEQWEHVLDR